MFSRRTETFLPTGYASVWTPPQAAIALKGFMNIGPIGLNKLELQKLGCRRPANAVYELRKLGASIVTEVGSVVDSQGRPRPRMAHYRLKSWDWTLKSKYVEELYI